MSESTIEGACVAVFGASGAIGRFLRPRLRQAGYRVLALSRKPHRDAPGEQWLQAELPQSVPELPSCRAIVSLGPLHHFAAWLEQAALAGRPCIVAMSSMSAESKREAPVDAEREIAEGLRAGEARLAEVCRRRGLRWTVLRSTLIYGDGSDRSLTPIARKAMRWRVFPIPSGRGLRQPVHAQDLASAVFAALESAAAGGCVLQIGGGERLTSREMFARVRRQLPRWTLPLPVPRPVLELAARLRPQLRGMIERLDRDLVADNRELEQRLDVHPGPFRPEGLF
jgi:nucleoside-diphosphate-sugar epimerase